MGTRNLPAVTKVSGSQKRSLLKQEPWKPEEQAKLAVVLGQIFDVRKQYGKNAGQLENILAGFCFALQPYSLEAVLNGLAEYMRQRPDMPAPADIVAIIDPKPHEWKPDKAYYVSLKKIYSEQGPYGLDNEEMEYIRRYEDYNQRQMREAE
jgi:hypothetical protein